MHLATLHRRLVSTTRTLAGMVRVAASPGRLRRWTHAGSVSEVRRSRRRKRSRLRRCRWRHQCSGACAGWGRLLIGRPFSFSCCYIELVVLESAGKRRLSELFANLLVRPMGGVALARMPEK